MVFSFPFFLSHSAEGANHQAVKYLQICIWNFCVYSHTCVRLRKPWYHVRICGCAYVFVCERKEQADRLETHQNVSSSHFLGVGTVSGFYFLYYTLLYFPKFLQSAFIIWEEISL